MVGSVQLGEAFARIAQTHAIGPRDLAVDEFHQTIVMVTHDPDLAARAQRNIHILDGRASDQPMPAAAVVTKLEARREAAHV